MTGRHVPHPRARPAALAGWLSGCVPWTSSHASSDKACPSLPRRDIARDAWRDRRDLRQRAVHDRGALVRDLRNPANARDLVRDAARHPATRELASAGLMFLPLRYLPVGWAATWVAHRVVGHHLDLPAEVPDESTFGATRRTKNVTPAGPRA